jgi:hypothetical protein
MLIAVGALEPAPAYAVVPEHIVASVLRDLAPDGGGRAELDRVFRRLEAEQPALTEFLASELSNLETADAQAVAYYLFLAVGQAFYSAFGGRLPALSSADLDHALDALLADGEVRSHACRVGSFSQDRVACLQPALMDAVMGEIDYAYGALAAAEPQGELESTTARNEIDPILQVLLVQVVALTRAVSPA